MTHAVPAFTMPPGSPHPRQPELSGLPINRLMNHNVAFCHFCGNPMLYSRDMAASIIQAPHARTIVKVQKWNDPSDVRNHCI